MKEWKQTKFQKQINVMIYIIAKLTEIRPQKLFLFSTNARCRLVCKWIFHSILQIHISREPVI